MMDTKDAAVTYRVLIVDDEDRDWAVPMQEALDRAARLAGVALRAKIANSGDDARKLIAGEHFHLVSLDMRLPERERELVSVNTGLKLAAEFPAVGYPKYLIYSQTLNRLRQGGRWDESESVRQLQADAYAKPTGASEPYQRDVPTLSPREWAQRVIACFDRQRLALDPDPGESVGKLTLLGAHFKRGPALLPPPLARAVHAAAEAWKPAAADADTVLAVAQETALLAVAQSAVLCAAGGGTPHWPADGSIAAALHTWHQMLTELRDWNWARYCPPAALAAIGAFVESPGSADASADLVLAHCLDIASYWARHPLCADPRNSRDGWTALPLRGTELPRRRQLLPPVQDYAAARDTTFAWQSVWHFDDPGKPPQPRLVDWTPALQRDTDDDSRWWLRRHASGPDRWLSSDLDSGRASER